MKKTFYKWHWPQASWVHLAVDLSKASARGEGAGPQVTLPTLEQQEYGGGSPVGMGAVAVLLPAAVQPSTSQASARGEGAGPQVTLPTLGQQVDGGGSPVGMGAVAALLPAAVQPSTSQAYARGEGAGPQATLPTLGQQVDGGGSPVGMGAVAALLPAAVQPSTSQGSARGEGAGPQVTLPTLGQQMDGGGSPVGMGAVADVAVLLPAAVQPPTSQGSARGEGAGPQVTLPTLGQQMNGGGSPVGMGAVADVAVLLPAAVQPPTSQASARGEGAGPQVTLPTLEQQEDGGGSPVGMGADPETAENATPPPPRVAGDLPTCHMREASSVDTSGGSKRGLPLDDLAGADAAPNASKKHRATGAHQEATSVLLPSTAGGPAHPEGAYKDMLRPPAVLTESTEKKLQGHKKRWHGKSSAVRTRARNNGPRNRQPKRSVIAHGRHRCLDVKKLRDVDASLFLCASPEDVAATVQRSGIAVIHDADLQRLAAAAAPHAVTYAEDNGFPIFEYVVLDEEDGIEKDGEGRPTMGTGTGRRNDGRRLQAILQDDAPAPLVTFKMRAETLLRPFLGAARRQPGVQSIKLMRPVVLVNKPGSTLVGPQAPHVDVKPGTMHAYIAFAPLEVDTTLLVASVRSHMTVRFWHDQVQRLKARGAGGAAAGGAAAGGSTSDGASAGGASASGATAGGASAGGAGAGGSTSGGTAADGAAAGGTTAGGASASGTTAGGASAGGSTSGGTAAGGASAGGAAASGTTAGGAFAGGAAAGGSTSGGTAADGAAAGGTTAGGTSASGTTAGGTAAGGITADGAAAGGAAAGGTAAGITRDGSSGGGEDSGYGTSDMDTDSDTDNEDGSVDDDIAATAVSVLSQHTILRLHVQPGQIVFLHGNTVHAGDGGKAKRWSPRMHWYVRPGKVKDRTHPVEGMHNMFAALFGPWGPIKE
ncbi:hypothetical protein PLESTB_000432500 [Pleodorina starrii]|uniref:Uncharacterized protein n=1 Tax=Pleodorina starrii TaxID=330485 RepID=A0A9W6BER0_9CHLO|nr:hypothetical protein PLESTB_000432500 [Pleodorina starrii]